MDKYLTIMWDKIQYIIIEIQLHFSLKTYSVIILSIRIMDASKLH